MSIPIPFSTCRFQDGVTNRCDYPSIIVVSAGLEPTHPEPKSGALPLGYETINEANMSKNFFFLFEVPIRFELMTPGYKAGILPNYTKEPNFWVQKNPNFLGSGLIFLFMFLVNLYQHINENALTCDLSVRYTLNDH